jgi:hypothetical protein
MGFTCNNFSHFRKPNGSSLYKVLKLKEKVKGLLLHYLLELLGPMGQNQRMVLSLNISDTPQDAR